MNSIQGHIFVDNSNLFIGAQVTAQRLEPAIPKGSIRVYYRNLFQLIEQSYLPVKRVLAGSVPPGNDHLWNHAKAWGYDTALLRRIAIDAGKQREQGVDEILHLRIAESLMDYDPPQALVLVTGDGGLGDFGTSFLRQIERALKRNWRVDLWSWSACLSKKFREISNPNFRIMVLDPFYLSITFVNGRDTALNRIVAPLDQLMVQP